MRARGISARPSEPFAESGPEPELTPLARVPEAAETERPALDRPALDSHSVRNLSSFVAEGFRFTGETVTPLEWPFLEQSLQTWMRDVEPVPRLAGALLTIGIHLARNPFEVLKIPLEGNHADDYGDWRLCTVTGSVTRKLSMHQDGWMPETDAQRNLVLPYLDELRLELPSVIKQILGEITLPASAEILFDLWQAVDAQKNFGCLVYGE